MPLTQPLRCRSQLRPALYSLHGLSNRHTTLQLRQSRVLRTAAVSRIHRRVSAPRLISTDFPRLSSFHLPSISPLMATQTRGHAGHGHGHHHHHHHDNVYLISRNKKDPGVRITRIGLAVNVAMAIGKFVGGYVFHSQALVADAYHALTDMVSDLMTLGTVAWSLKPPTERFPNGYGKIESLGALGVSSLLLCGGVFMGLNAGQVLLSQFFPEAFEFLAHSGLLLHGLSHGHSHGVEALGPNVNAAWLAAGSIVLKEWLYRATMKIAKERKSSVLASNAVHHRIDSLTSIVALVTIGGTHLFSDASWLDPVGGLIISLMVIQAGWENTRASLLELADTTVDNEIKFSVRKAASGALSEALSGEEVEIRDIQGMKSGQNYLMEVEVAVPGSWPIHRSRQIEEIVRKGVGSHVRGVRRVKVRFVPQEEKETDFTEEFIPPEVNPQGSPQAETETNHHDHHNHDANHHDHSHDHESVVHKRR